MAWVYHNKPPMGWPLDLSEPINNDLVGYWLSNEGSGDTVQDLSENNRNGILTGTAPSWSPGKFGHALFLPGTDEFVGCGVGYNSIVNAPFSVGGWAYQNAAGGVGEFMILYGFFNEANSQHMAISAQNDGGTNKLKIVSLGETPGVGSNIPINNWYHFFLTYDGSDLHAYLNGVLDYDITPGGASWQTSVEFHIGNIGGLSAGIRLFWNGLVDGCSMYSRCLSATEIALLHRFPFYGFLNPDEEPVLDQYYTVGVGANPKGPLGHPLHGALAGPISF